RDVNSVKVLVLSGSVRILAPALQAKNNVARLTAGEVAVADNRSIKVTRESAAEIADALSWRTGILVFRYTPLSEVAAEFNRYNSEKIIVDDTPASKSVISARLHATDVEAFARMARDFMGLRIQRENDRIHISR